ncbi:MAG TPA: hypothetical protein EYM27_01700 [Dehalococcoidia bacterium]|nr:hypothetical protein [Dehalococcoidia bacterium]
MTSPRESGWTIINMQKEAVNANPITRGILKEVSPGTRRLWHYGAPGDGAPLYDDYRHYYEAATGRDTGFIGRNTQQKGCDARQRPRAS